MQSPEYPDLIWLECRWFNVGRPVGQPTKIVIHKTDNPTSTAMDEATYAMRRPDSVSAHYFVDAARVIQGVHTANTAYAALSHGNADGIQYELCDVSDTSTPYATLVNAARQIARDMTKYRIPLRRLHGREVRNREAKGLAGHVDFTLGWPKDGGTHTDPGPDFEWDTLFSLINGFLGGNGMTDETNTTEEHIELLLDKGRRWINDTETAADHPALRPPIPPPSATGSWSRPNAWIARRLLELEYWLRLPPPPVTVVLSDEQLAALAETVTDQVLARLPALRFEPQDGGPGVRP